MDTDRNLLVGVLALQVGLIDNSQFAEACGAWAARRDRPLADLLVERGWLTTASRGLVEQLLSQRLTRTAGDVRASLADSLARLPRQDVQRALAVLNDPALDASIAPGEDSRPLESTVVPVPSRERYTRLRLHARGGLGQVWLGRDRGLNREVAIKELRPEYTAAVYEARFLAEAQITGQLEH